MQHVINHVEVDYVGLDIAPDIIDQNTRQHETAKTKFFVQNICTQKIPDCDIVIVRDSLFHLSFDDISDFLENLQSTNYKYLITTTYKLGDGFQNSDIKTADFRIINLFSSPFNFKEKDIIDRIHEGQENGYARELIVIPKKHVPSTLKSSY